MWRLLVQWPDETNMKKRCAPYLMVLCILIMKTMLLSSQLYKHMRRPFPKPGPVINKFIQIHIFTEISSFP